MPRKKSKPKKPKKKKKKVKKKEGVRKKKAKKRVTKRRARKKTRLVEEPMFEEITYNCPGCGRPMKVVKVSGYDVSGMLCQRCAHGDIAMEEESGED